jgi:Prokaryotic N-terminal methylation motif
MPVCDRLPLNAAEPSGRCRSERGQGLVELLIALTLLSVVITTLVASFGSSISSLEHTGSEDTAITLADRQLETYRSMPFNCVPTTLTGTPPANCQSFTGFPNPYAASQTVSGADAPDHRSYLVTTSVSSAGGETRLTVNVALSSGGASLARESSEFSAAGSQTDAVSTNTPTALVFTTSAPTVAAGGTSSVITVQRRDSSGNPTTSGTTNISLSSSSSGGAFRDSTNSTTITAISIPSGSTSVSFLYTDTTAGSATITAADIARVLTSATEDVTVTAGTVAQLAVTGYPVSTSAGTSHSFIVTAEDVFGNLVSSYSDMVSFTATNDAQAVLPPNTALTGGIGSFNATFKTISGGTKTLTATDTANHAITGSESGITVTAAAPASLQLAATTTTPAAGTADSLTITAYDSLGNVATSYTGSKTLTFSGASTIGAYQPTVTSSAGSAVSFGSATTITFTNGVATVSGSSNGAMTLYKAGAATIAVTDGSISSNGLGVTASAGAVNHFGVVAPATATAGTAFSTTVLTAVDLYGNTVTSYTGSHTIAWSGAATSPSPSSTAPSYPATAVTFASGVATTTLTATLYSVAGPNVLTATATSPSLTGSSASIALSSGSADHLAVGAPASATAGTAFSTVTLAAHDLWDNIATSYTGSHTIAWSGAATSPSPSSTAPSYPATAVTFTSGAATTTLTATLYSTAGPNKLTASATSPALTGSSGTIAVAAGAADHFALGAPTTATAGTAFATVTLATHDQWDNIVTSYTGGHTIAWSGATTSPNNNAPVYPTTSVSFTNGASTTTLSATLFAAGSNSLTAAATSPTVTGTATISVNAGAPYGLAYSGSSIACNGGLTVNVGNGGTWTSSVSVADRYGNPVVNSLGNAITVGVAQSPTGTGTLTVPSPYTIASGSAQTSSSFSFKASKGNPPTVTLTATASGSGTTGWTTATCLVAR